MYEESEMNNDSNGEESYERKGKNWIHFSILEKSFKNSYYEIYEHLEDNGLLGKKDDILVKYKNEIKIILKELNGIDFNNIYNSDYENYREFLNEIKSNNNNSSKNLETLLGSPILDERRILSEQKKTNKEIIYNDAYELISELEIDKIFLKYDNPGNFNDSFSFDEIDKKKEQSIKNKKDDFEFQKAADFGPSIIDNFYTFAPKSKAHRKSIAFEEDKNSNFIITNSINEDEFCNNICEFKRGNSDLILHIEKPERHLPSDNLYDLRNNTINKKEEIIYNKKKTVISNSHYLYLKKYYNNASYFKFYNHNLHEKITSIKQQNYQCFICLKKISNIKGFPLEPIYWCSYYLHFVCKKCIANEFCIIPNIILNHWNFEKYSVSKKAKQIIETYYKVPIIYLKNNDKILKRIPKSIKNLKTDIKNIYNYIKCDENIVLEDIIIPDYKYLIFEQNIFSLKDLLEIHNKTLIKKLKEIKNKLVNHIMNECQICKYNGHKCHICSSDEVIYFYDSENIVYKEENNKCYHKKCENQS